MTANDEFPKMIPDEEMHVLNLGTVVQGDYPHIIKMLAMILQHNMYIQPGAFFRSITLNDIPCIVHDIILSPDQRNMTALVVLLAKCEGMSDFANPDIVNDEVADNLRIMLKLACCAARIDLPMSYERFTIFNDEYLIGKTKTLKHYKELTKEVFDIAVVEKELMNDS